jgi:(p)ppGpp synthase/HD superfamily hydrolase
LDFELINKSIHWARKYHGDQKRKSGEPYYSHPLEVAYMVSEYQLKTDLIVGSILHDIVEDTEVVAACFRNESGSLSSIKTGSN